MTFEHYWASLIKKTPELDQDVVVRMDALSLKAVVGRAFHAGMQHQRELVALAENFAELVPRMEAAMKETESEAFDNFFKSVFGGKS